MNDFFKKEDIKNNRFYAFLYRFFILLRAFGIIALCLFLGNYVSDLLRHVNALTIPGSILGLLLLFLLLMLHLIPVHWIKDGSELLTRYMIVLFVPATMGIMETYPLLLNDWGPIFIGNIGSTLMVLILTAHLTQRIIHRHHHSGEDDWQQGES